MENQIGRKMIAKYVRTTTRISVHCLEVYRAKKDIAVAGPEPELLTLPGLSGYWSRAAGSDDDLGGRAMAGPV